MTRWTLVLVIMTATCAGCRPPAAEAETEAGPESVAAAGDVRMTVRLDAGDIVVGEPVTLTVELVAPPQIDVTMPAVGETLGPFSVRSAHTPPDVPEAAGRRWVHRYELDTFAAGALTVPTLTTRLVDRRVEPAAETRLASDPLVVTVASVVGVDATAADLRDIKGGVDVPIAGERAWMPLAAAALLLVGIIAAWQWWRRRGRETVSEPPVPPHVWARRALDALEAERLVETGAVEVFYVRLSDIVRQYIERRFGLTAPEQTTDEFLRAARADTRLAVGHQELLASFLRAADLVKFARHEPTATESVSAFASARSFVDETTPDDRVVSDTPPALAAGAAS
ncbi:MAG: hypothetical protein KJO43_00810 [Phycisphaerae bacterium]|nr:hypothetical protein [Phycisphaerae bacterium]